MSGVVKTMAIIRYYRDGRPSSAEIVREPAWGEVVAAVDRMDNSCFPIVVLSLLECESDEEVLEDEDAFNIIGGSGRFALFQMVDGWQFDDPNGSFAEVQLWESDQGYFCKEKNVVGTEKALRIVRAYFESGSYDELDLIQ